MSSSPKMRSQTSSHGPSLSLGIFPLHRPSSPCFDVIPSCEEQQPPPSSQQQQQSSASLGQTASDCQPVLADLGGQQRSCPLVTSTSRDQKKSSELQLQSPRSPRATAAVASAPQSNQDMGHQLSEQEGSEPALSFQSRHTLDLEEAVIFQTSPHKPNTREESPAIDQDIIRFQQRLNAAVMELVDYPRQLPFPEFKKLPRNKRAMGTSAFVIFNVSEASSLADLILKSIPHYVQKALGKVRPTFDDLVAMPEPTADQRKCWLVYVDATVRWQMSGSAGNRHRTGLILRRGKYVGASVDSRGGGVRLDRHAQAAKSKKSIEAKQRHHAELCQEGTEANLRILASFDCDQQLKPYVPLAETIFMALIGTFAGRERMGEYNPQTCYELYDSIRNRSRMPDIDGDGLNGALSIHQGMVGVVSGRQTYHCIVCKLVLLPGTSVRDHSRLVQPGNPIGPRRCGTSF